MPRKKAAPAAELRDQDLPSSVVLDAQSVPPKIDRFTRRSDADVLPGGFCKIDSGPHEGEIGYFESVVSEDADGYPETVLVHLRNSATIVAVDYADITPVQFGGR